jgi:hypothetical protein
MSKPGSGQAGQPCHKAIVVTACGGLEESGYAYAASVGATDQLADSPWTIQAVTLDAAQEF